MRYATPYIAKNAVKSWCLVYNTNFYMIQYFSEFQQKMFAHRLILRICGVLLAFCLVKRDSNLC